MGRRPRPWFWTQVGEWCVTIDGQRHRLGPDKEEAERKFHELMSKPDRIPSKSVVAVIDLFLDWTEKHRASLTYDWYKKHLQSFVSHLKPKTLTVDKLKPHHIDAWIDTQQWGDSYRRGAMTAVDRALNWAEKKGHIDRNPIRRKLDKPAAGRRERVISHEEYETILKHVKGNFRDVLVVAWETGARPQEICRVEARHVDLENGRWVFHYKEAKGKKYDRIIYLSETALEITRRLMEKHPEGPLFRTIFGNPWDRHKVSDAFQRLKEKLGTKYRLYDFRHSFVTHGLKNGVDPVTMANLVGHKDLTMIHRIYSHISQDPDHMRRMAMKAVQ